LDGKIRLLDAKTGQDIRKLIGHTNWVPRVEFSPDTRRAASCSQDKSIRVWDVPSGREVAQFTPSEINGQDFLSFSSNGSVLAASLLNERGARNIIYTWDVDAKVQLARIEVPQRFFARAELSPDARYLAGGGGLAPREKPGSESAVFIWNAITGRILHALPGHDTEEIRPGASPDYSSDGQCSFSGPGWRPK
jgi:WD40 repeat protein